jgi:hypothetical protein
MKSWGDIIVKQHDRGSGFSTIASILRNRYPRHHFEYDGCIDAITLPGYVAEDDYGTDRLTGAKTSRDAAREFAKRRDLSEGNYVHVCVYRERWMSDVAGATRSVVDVHWYWVYRYGDDDYDVVQDQEGSR